MIKPYRGKLVNATMVRDTIYGEVLDSRHEPVRPDGRVIQTSKIVEMYECDGFYYVETLNSIYYVTFQ